MTETDRTTKVSAKESSSIPAEQAEAIQHAPMTVEQLRAVHIGDLVPHNAPIHVVEYDQEGPQLFELQAKRIRTALGERILLLEHVGSTSVPGLAAKPRIDLLLVVADSTDESAYVPALEAAGYVLHIREPAWYEHRKFNGSDIALNLHVFSAGCPEIDRMLLFRDWLRSHSPDRELYERTKRELAQRNWTYTQNYADAKTALVEEILARARGMGGQKACGEG